MCYYYGQLFFVTCYRRTTGGQMFNIIPFQEKYRDDTIFCLLSAKDALGDVPRLTEDFLNIQEYFFDKGDMFWIALDETGRVIGMLGTDTVSSTDMWLRRLFIKPELKRHGLGSVLYSVAEKYAIAKGIYIIHTRFPDNYIEASKFYLAKGFVDAGKHEGLPYMIKYLRQ